MNRIDSVSFASALTLAFLVLYVACAAAVALFPAGTVDFFNAWFHGLDLNLLRPPAGRPLTFSQFVLGAFAVIVVAFPGGLVMAGLYNLFTSGHRTTSLQPRAT